LYASSTCKVCPKPQQAKSRLVIGILNLANFTGVNHRIKNTTPPAVTDGVALAVEAYLRREAPNDAMAVSDHRRRNPYRQQETTEVR